MCYYNWLFISFKRIILYMYIFYRYLSNVKRNYKDWMKNALNTDVKVLFSSNVFTILIVYIK